MTSATTSLSSEDLRRVRQELWSNLQQIDTRLKQNYVPPHFRITTSATNNQRTFSTNGHSSSATGEGATNTPNVKRSRQSSSSFDEYQHSSLPENNDASTNIDDISSQTLHSSIVTTNKIIKTKDDLISLVNRDQASAGRNRRMFGVLLGTLNKFKAEANAYNEQIPGMKRHEIERRLEQKQVKEREDQQHERSELIASKKTCQQKLKLVNIKLELIERMAAHEKTNLPLRNFIRTHTKPYIFYLPKGTLDATLQAKLEETQTEIDKEMADFKRDCQRELDLMDDSDESFSVVVANSKKRKLSDENEERDDDDDALADLPDEITLSAPEIKSEIIGMHAAVEQPTDTVVMSTTRTVIFEETPATNEEEEPSMVEE